MHETLLPGSRNARRTTDHAEPRKSRFRGLTMSHFGPPDSIRRRVGRPLFGRGGPDLRIFRAGPAQVPAVRFPLRRESPRELPVCARRPARSVQGGSEASPAGREYRLRGVPEGPPSGHGGPKPSKTGFWPGVPNGPVPRVIECCREPVFGPAWGVQGFGPKTAKMPIFTVFRRRPSIS